MESEIKGNERLVSAAVHRRCSRGSGGRTGARWRCRPSAWISRVGVVVGTKVTSVVQLFKKRPAGACVGKRERVCGEGEICVVVELVLYDGCFSRHGRRVLRVSCTESHHHIIACLVPTPPLALRLMLPRLM